MSQKDTLHAFKTAGYSQHDHSVQLNLGDVDV